MSDGLQDNDGKQILVSIGLNLENSHFIFCEILFS